MKTKRDLNQNDFKKSISSKLLLLVFTMCFVNSIYAQFVHPGLSHKLSDLERMKAMIEAGEEPWASSFENLKTQARAQYDYVVTVKNQDPSYVIEYSGASDDLFKGDSTAAYLNALMWYFTGDSRHADKAVEIFNTWSTLKRSTTKFALTNGRIVRVLEAAEIIKSTYSGWSATDIQAFQDMLVYPGWSGTTVPTASIASNDVTFYWRIYNGDAERIGNQGLLGMRLMMTMGIFMDNEIMYDRALRYLRGYAHRVDDLPYPSGPPLQGTLTSDCEWGKTWSSGGLLSTIPDYGYNEVIGHYIYENGQCQEASRDQAHSIGGVATINLMAEIAWSQGDNLYAHLNNRILLGLEYVTKYNLSYEVSYPDQLTPWEPTIENGEFLQKTTRHLRRELLKINPGVDCDQTNWTRGLNNDEAIYDLPLGHYRDRLKTLPSEEYKWLERGQDYVAEKIGYEIGDFNTVQLPLYGSLLFRRVSPGDPISGFDGDGLPLYKLHDLSISIEAENYDYFVLNGQDRTYNDTSSSNEGGEYRTDEGVDIKDCSEGGYCVTNIDDGEWLTYTVNVPANGTYDIDVRYASANANGKIKFNFGDADVTSDVTVPFGGANSTGLTDWQDIEVANEIHLTQGVQAMKVLFSGANDAFELNNIAIALVTADPPDPDPVNLAVLYGAATQSTDRNNGTGLAPLAIDGDTNGVFGNGSVTHTTGNATSDPEPWWQVDLGDNYNIETIDIYNRTDCCSDRLNNFTVQVLDSNGNETFSKFYATAPSNAFTVTTGDVVGSVIRISKTSTDALSFAEVEVYGIDTVLSNKKFELSSQIKVYPNPVTNMLNISNGLGYNVSIYSILGTKVLTTMLYQTNQIIDVNSLKPGVYFIKIDNGNSSLTKKIIKE